MRILAKVVLSTVFSALFMLAGAVALDSFVEMTSGSISQSGIAPAVMVLLVVIIGGPIGLCNAALSLVVKDSPISRFALFCAGGVVFTNVACALVGIKPVTAASFVFVMCVGLVLGIGSWVGFNAPDWISRNKS